MVLTAVTCLDMLAHPEILQLSSTLRRDDAALQAFDIFAEDNATKGCQPLEELRLVDDLLEGYLLELADARIT